MGSVLFIACTNVGRYMVEEMLNNQSIHSTIAGIVNLDQNRARSKANYDSYADLEIKYGIPIYYCDNVNSAESLEWIQNRRPDIIIQSGWSQKFSDELLNLPPYGCIGEHPSPLPKGRGAACVNWAILTGEKHWGDTFFQMVSDYDKGKIYAQGFFEIEEHDDVFTVYEKVAASSKAIIAENIDKWSEGEFTALEQNEDNATYYKKRSPADGEILTFDHSAKQINDFIRAQTHPYPGAFFLYNGIRTTILRSRVAGVSDNTAVSGIVLGESPEGGIYVSCSGHSVLEILRLKPENSPSMWAKDWALQAGIKPWISRLP
jgi:methionyl-tRNA formyltransferase